MSNSLPLLVVEGVFYRHESAVYVALEAGGTVRVSDLLGPYVGKAVDYSAHHWPPNPPQSNRPGLGTCFWNGHCPQHARDPAWLYSATYEGVLESACVESLGLDPLVGHRSRLVLFSEPPDVDGQDLDSLLNMAEDLSRTLQGLQKVADGE